MPDRYDIALARAREIVGKARVRAFFKYARRFGKPTDAAALERLVELTLKGREIKRSTRTNEALRNSPYGEE